MSVKSEVLFIKFTADMFFILTIFTVPMIFLKIFIVMFFMFSVALHAQNTQMELPQHCEVYICKNANNTTEKLYVSTLDNKVWYTHSNSPNKLIPLKIVQSTRKDEKGNFILYEATSYVQFPNSSTKYKLESASIASDEIKCTNPDGSVQIFKTDWGLQGAYGTYRNTTGTAFLYIKNTGNGKVLVKYASKNDGYKWQNLTVEKINIGDMGDLDNCSVRFPLSKEDEYYLTVETKPLTPSFYIITLQHASMTQKPEEYYWINK